MKNLRKLVDLATTCQVPCQNYGRPLTGPNSLWKPVHDRFLAAYVYVGVDELARILNRTPSAIKARIKFLNPRKGKL